MMPVIWILRDEKECVELADQNRVGLPAQLNVRLQPESTAGVTAVKRPHVVLEAVPRAPDKASHQRIYPRGNGKEERNTGGKEETREQQKMERE
ncbi:uncharacterized [Tachysurus ichikawai]